jgi:hypothetical protein
MELLNFAFAVPTLSIVAPSLEFWPLLERLIYHGTKKYQTYISEKASQIHG